MKRLSVFDGDQWVGHLQENEQFELVFIYSPQWLTQTDAIPLSVNLPLAEQAFTGDAVTAFFENLLPDRFVEHLRHLPDPSLSQRPRNADDFTQHAE